MLTDCRVQWSGVSCTQHGPTVIGPSRMSSHKPKLPFTPGNDSLSHCELFPEITIPSLMLVVPSTQVSHDCYTTPCTLQACCYICYITISGMQSLTSCCPDRLLFLLYLLLSPACELCSVKCLTATVDCRRLMAVILSAHPVLS